MLRVVLVVWGFERFGGMEQHVLQLALALHRAGVSVSVVSEMPVPRSSYYARALRAAGVGFHAAPRAIWLANGIHLALDGDKRRLIHGSGILSHWLLRTLRTLSQARKVDVLHVHGCRLGQIWLAQWARARGIALVYTEHVTIGELGGPLTPEAPRWALGATLSCVSEHSRASLAASLADPRPIVVTRHIVPVPDLGPRAARERPLEILCAARLETHKGVDLLLAAFAIVAPTHPDAHLTIAGSGSEASALKRQARELGIAARVTFTGTLSPDDMASALARADIVVLPSRTEGLPLALLEAMAAAKPVIASMVGGIPEVIEPGANGMLVKSEDAQGLARAITALLDDPVLRQQLGAAARRSFEASHYHESRVIPEMLKLYATAMAC